MSDLEEKVKSWITEQGYPLEMLIAKNTARPDSKRLNLNTSSTLKVATTEK
jgi:hypothetical protein